VYIFDVKYKAGDYNDGTIRLINIRRESEGEILIKTFIPNRSLPFYFTKLFPLELVE